MCLDSGRKLESADRTHADMWRTCAPHSRQHVNIKHHIWVIITQRCILLYLLSAASCESTTVGNQLTPGSWLSEPVSAAAPERDSVQLQHFGLQCDRRSSVDRRDPAAGGELVHVLLDQEERPAAADQDPHLWRQTHRRSSCLHRSRFENNCHEIINNIVNESV